jgi:hypothetical protein
MHAFDEATHVELLPTGRYAARTSQRFWNAHGAFGGTTAATVVRALSHGAEGDQRVASLTLHFLGSLSAPSFEIAITHERRTASLTFARVEVYQGVQLMLSGLAVLARARSEPTFRSIRPPEVLADGPSERWIEGEQLASFTREFDYAFVRGLPFSDQQALVSSGWIGLKRARELDLPLLTAYSDAWPPVLWAALPRPTVFSTLVMNVFFRAGPTELARHRDAGRVFVDLASSFGSDGLIDERQDVWSASGVLLSQTTQVCRYTVKSPEHASLAGYRLVGQKTPAR